MASLVSSSVLRNVASFVAVLCVVLGGTWAAVHLTTNHLLYQNATAAARSWAQFLTANVTDLEQIAAGEKPSSASMAFFVHAQKSDQVFRYEIYDRSGFSLLVSDHNNDRVTIVDVSDFSPEAAQSAKTAQPVVGTKEGLEPGQPRFFAQAFMPVTADGHVIGVVAAFVDQTEQRASYNKVFLIAAASLCLLTGLSFAVPTIAWYRRTREKQVADRRIRYLAHHDALTGLVNRAQLVELLEKALAVQPLRQARFAVHFIDLDRFKEVNDTLGHDAGDFLLKTVAERLRAVIRRDDVAARLGGDEFVVLQTRVHEKRDAEELAQRLLIAVVAPMVFKDQEIIARASVGIAMGPTDGTTSERLLKSADLALYAAKTDGRHCIRFFAPAMDATLQARLALERLIRGAVAHGRFVQHFQPIFDATDRRLAGFEALLRLPAEDGTLIPPGIFLPVAEDMRLIDKIGVWVLREACRTAMTWPDHLTIAVNLSPEQFDAGNVDTLVADVLAETGLSPHRLEIEITENVLLGSGEAIMAQLQALRAMGVAVVMDDFGTGYSSLSYLWRFPFNKIKIDRSLAQGLGNATREAETVMKTVIALGRELRMGVVVEGIETSDQAAVVDAAQSDQVQGFFFGKPLSASEIASGLLADFQRQAQTKPATNGAVPGREPRTTWRA
jgi:diguanylate cyclase (GGDEF)-like protein